MTQAMEVPPQKRYPDGRHDREPDCAAAPSAVRASDTFDPAGWIRPWLRLEGLAVFAAGLAGFLALGLPWYAVRAAVARAGRVGRRLPARAAGGRRRLQHRPRPVHGFGRRGHRARARDPCRSSRSGPCSSPTAGWTGWPGTASSCRRRSRTRIWDGSAGPSRRSPGRGRPWNGSDGGVRPVVVSVVEALEVPRARRRGRGRRARASARRRP